MTNITIRNIPDETIDKIRSLSKIEKRSINNEILCLLEKSANSEFYDNLNKNRFINKNLQISMWKKLSGRWKDSRKTSEIISDIKNSRSLGREIQL